jgi:hypothetical protein
MFLWQVQYEGATKKMRGSAEKSQSRENASGRRKDKAPAYLPSSGAEIGACFLDPFLETSSTIFFAFPPVTFIISLKLLLSAL